MATTNEAEALRSDDGRPVAGNGLLDRRLFLKHWTGAGVGLFAMTGAARAGENLPDWMRRPGLPFSNYGLPSPHESTVVRWISANSASPGNGVSWCPLHELEGIITPSGLHFERHHNGVPEIDPAAHRLLLHGLVDRPLEWGIEDLLRYPRCARLLFIECGGNSNAGWQSKPIQSPAGYVHGLASCSEWSGVPLGVLLDEAGVRPDARWVLAEGADAFAMHVSLPIEKARDDVFVALYQNGERLRPQNGYPIRLIVPGWEGVVNVKWLRQLKLTAVPAMARNETARYTELLPSGKARMFTFVIEAKSLITAPSAGMTLAGPGYYPISGLAWSGRGRVRAVEVSADGGESWAPAALEEPVLPMCFTRFRIPWRWNGGPAVLESRVTDSTGYVQPQRTALVEERGVHGYFHYNAIVAWRVNEDGRVEHVYA